MTQSASAGAVARLNIQFGQVFLVIIMILAGLRIANAQPSSGSNVVLVGNHPVEATTMSPVAHANSAAQLNMEVTLGLRNITALNQLLHDQQDPTSPRYHQWLSSEQSTAQFGPTQQDAETVAQWLTSQGFQVTATSLQERYVRFSGSLANAERVFATDIMTFGDGSSYSNTTDPMIPAQFAGIIVGIRGLNNFLHWKAFNNRADSSSVTSRPDSGWSAGPLALLNTPSDDQSPLRRVVSSRPQAIVDDFEAFGPSDFYSFYDENPLLKSGTNGSGGDCIGIIGDSDYLHSGLPAFDAQFGLPVSTPITVLADGTNPGVNNDETEALLDLQWSHAVAPGAPIRFYLGNGSTSTSNGPIVDGIQRAVNDNTCGVISVSFSLCGAGATFYTKTVHDIYLMAQSHGQSIFISSGDDGAAGLVLNEAGTQCVTGTSRNVNELGADPLVTSVGGTLFFANFDALGNNVGNVPESAWNDGSGATGGGVSMYFAQPAFQTGLGVPVGGNRDVPDVAIFASPNNPGAFIAYDESCGPGLNTCTGAGPVGFIPIGGTSLSAPSWAGISKLIAQLNHARLGSLNMTIYKLAHFGQAAVGFRDVSSGNNDFNGVTGFDATVGYDLTTGWGTADIDTFANSYVRGGPPTASPTPTPTPTPTHAPTGTRTPTRTPTPTPTFGPPPVITSIPPTIDVGGSFAIGGSHFSSGAVVNLFISTSSGTFNPGAITPSSKSPTSLTVEIPASVKLGQGFAEVQVVNTDQGYKASNSLPALLQGSAAAGIPTLTQINHVGLAATSREPSYAANNVETIVEQGTSVTLNGTGFDAVNGVAVNVFCACTGGKMGPFMVTPGPGLTSTSFSFPLPAAVPTGPASMVVINKGADGDFSKSSNAVSVPIGAAITVTSVTQSAGTVTVNGTGFSRLTVINLFNQQGGKTVNLGGLGAGHTAKIPLAVIDSTKFTFTRPADAVAGPGYVQAINPPFVPFTSSGSDPGGAFTL